MCLTEAQSGKAHTARACLQRLHTNGYTLVRALMERAPDLATRMVEGETFLDAIMEAAHALSPRAGGSLWRPGLHALAHITGGVSTTT